MAQDDYLDDSESSENKMTLEPADYSIWMPKISYKKLMEHKSKMYHNECTICFGDLSENAIRKVIVCGHIFHDECLIKWLKERETCPNCKHSLTKSTMEERREELLETSKIEKRMHGAEDSQHEHADCSVSEAPSICPSKILKDLDKSGDKSAKSTPIKLDQIERLDQRSKLNESGLMMPHI
jgi:hypothetical protein